MSGTEPVPRIGRGRCGCASTDCSCTVFGSGTVSVIGSGSETDPFKFIADAHFVMQVLDTPGVNLTLTGTGTPADPYILSGVADTTSATTAIYLRSGSPYNVTLPGSVRGMAVTCIGGGGGGGGGEVGTNGRGGGGGRGGAITQMFVDMPASPAGWDLSVLVGQGGVGDISYGVQGGLSRVERRAIGSGIWELVVRSDGGLGGTPGTSNGQTDNTWPQIGAVRGGDGGWSNGANPSPDTAWAPGGGGAGRSFGSNARAAGNGGSVITRGIVGGVVAGALPGGYGGGAGGGQGLVGQNGGFPGGGGGGGGGNTSGSGGIGGAGADGVVMIVTW